MDTSFRSHSGIGIALIVGALAASGPGCAPTGATRPIPAWQMTTSGEIGPAISSPADGPTMRVGEARVLTSKVNLQEPIMVGVEGSDVTITVAAQGHRGWTFALDPEALAAHAVTPYDYEDHPRRPQLGCLVQDPDRLKLRDGRTLGVWTDEATSRVVAQIFDAEGLASGPEVTVSRPAADVIGAPRAVTSDGRHVVIAYFATADAGFDLVARSLEAR
ncbi:hypothetical protein BH11MYX4_BH11MYX4_39650 [soil metagenome]